MEQKSRTGEARPSPGSRETLSEPFEQQEPKVRAIPGLGFPGLRFVIFRWPGSLTRRTTPCSVRVQASFDLPSHCMAGTRFSGMLTDAGLQRWNPCSWRPFIQRLTIVVRRCTAMFVDSGMVPADRSRQRQGVAFRKVAPVSAGFVRRSASSPNTRRSMVASIDTSGERRFVVKMRDGHGSPLARASASSRRKSGTFSVTSAHFVAMAATSTSKSGQFWPQRSWPHLRKRINAQRLGLSTCKTGALPLSFGPMLTYA